MSVDASWYALCFSVGNESSCEPNAFTELLSAILVQLCGALTKLSSIRVQSSRNRVVSWPLRFFFVVFLQKFFSVSIVKCLQGRTQGAAAEYINNINIYAEQGCQTSMFSSKLQSGTQFETRKAAIEKNAIERLVSNSFRMFWHRHRYESPKSSLDVVGGNSFAWQRLNEVWLWCEVVNLRRWGSAGVASPNRQVGADGINLGGYIGMCVGLVSGVWGSM